MNDLFSFDHMVTPKLITVIYWLLLAGVVLGGLASMFVGGFGIGKVLEGLIGIVIGALLVRVWCELMIVMFKMNEALQDLRNRK